MSDVTLSGTTPTTCLCCTGAGLITFACRTRGGTASIVGNPEFGTASVPPKKFRTTNVSGSWGTCNYAFADIGCALSAGASDRMEYTGQCVYNALSGLPVNSLARNYASSLVQSCSPGAASPFDTMICDRAYHPSGISSGDYIGVQGIVTDVTNTFRKWDYLNGVVSPCTLTGGSPNLRRTWKGEVDWQLTDEDTDSDALTRLQNLAVWSAFNPASNCLAQYQQRVTGFDFVWKEAEFQINGSHFAPSNPVTFEVSFFRAPYGGAFTLFQTVTFNVVADSLGNFTGTGSVPNELGFETYATPPVIIP